MVGPFANLSDDLIVLCDSLGRFRAHRAINSWNISPKHELAINRHILITQFRHMVALAWARLILRRFRDSVLLDITHSAADSDAFQINISLIPIEEHIMVDMIYPRGLV